MSRGRGALRRAARSATLVVVAALLLIVAGLPGLAAASARQAPDDDYAGRLSFTVDAVDPVLVTAAGPTSVTVSGTVTNTGAEAITELIYRFQRGSAVATTADLRAELEQPGEPTAAVPPRFDTLLDRLDPGQSASFTATVPLNGTGGIGVQNPGVYPLLLNVNGDVDLSTGPLAARVGELHLVLPVLGVPGSSGSSPSDPVRPLGVSVLWPFVDTPHLGVGGVFRDDDLAAEIAPGGRLATLLEGLTGQTAQELPAGTITLALDPQLLDELDRMSQGYQVLTGPQQALALAPTDTSTTTASAPPSSSASTGTSAGTTAPSTGATSEPVTGGAVGMDGNQVVNGVGQTDAQRFLADLRTVVARFPTILLPLADPDAVALTRNGLADDVATATAAGRTVATRVLGGELAARLVTSTAYPAQGLLDDATAGTLARAGATSAILAATGIGDADGRSRPSAVTLTMDDGTDTGLRAALTQVGGLGDLALLAGQEAGGNWSLRVNALTGLLYQQVRDDSAAGGGTGGGGATPVTVIAPNRQWSPNLASLQRLQQVLVTLGRSGLTTGTALSTVLDRAQTTAPLRYPESAQQSELDPDYLDQVRAARTEVGQLRSSFAAQNQPQDPAPVLDALDQALLTAGSTAYRALPSGGRDNLQTVRATLDELHAGVQIASSGATYTLASSSSPLLVTVQNSLPYDVTVTVRIVGGEYVGLAATEPPSQVVPAGRSVPFRIATQVSRSGQFQVSAEVVGADGAAWGRSVPLSVQSSAFGAVTVVIIAVAGAVLLVMVVLRVRQRLRDRRARIAAEQVGRHPGPDPDGGSDPVLGEASSDETTAR